MLQLRKRGCHTGCSNLSEDKTRGRKCPYAPRNPAWKASRRPLGIEPGAQSMTTLAQIYAKTHLVLVGHRFGLEPSALSPARFPFAAAVTISTIVPPSSPPAGGPSLSLGSLETRRIRKFPTFGVGHSRKITAGSRTCADYHFPNSPRPNELCLCVLCMLLNQYLLVVLVVYRYLRARLGLVDLRNDCTPVPFLSSSKPWFGSIVFRRRAALQNKCRT